jgi:protein TilB
MKSENCPEIRCEIAEKSRRAKRGNEIDPAERKEENFTPKLFAPCGRPYCLNMPKLDFTFNDERDRYELDLHVYKYIR